MNDRPRTSRFLRRASFERVQAVFDSVVVVVDRIKS
jgi:hypothetical protein